MPPAALKTTAQLPPRRPRAARPAPRAERQNEPLAGPGGDRPNTASGSSQATWPARKGDASRSGPAGGFSRRLPSRAGPAACRAAPGRPGNRRWQRVTVGGASASARRPRLTKRCRPLWSSASSSIELAGLLPAKGRSSSGVRSKASGQESATRPSTASAPNNCVDRCRSRAARPAHRPEERPGARPAPPASSH